MPDIGIGIKVNHSQVGSAKKSMDGLKSSLDDVRENSDLTIGNDGKSMDGAVKNARQFKKEMEGASTATAKMVKDYDKLIKTATSRVAGNLIDRPVRASVGSGTASDYDEALKRSAEMGVKTKRKTAAEQYFEQHGDYGRTVTSHDGVGNGSGGNGYVSPHLLSLAKSAGLIALGWAGMSSVSGVLTSAKDRAKEYAERDLPLQLRGVTIADETLERMATKYGIRPGKTQATVDILSRTTGLRDVAGLMDKIASYSVGTSARPEETATYIGSVFPHVKDNSNSTGLNINRLLTQGLLLAKNTGRYNELFSSFQSVLESTTQLRGGSPMVDKSAESLASTMGLMWTSKDKTLQGASGANLLNQIGQGIATGGSTPGAQMFLGQALGIERVNSGSELWAFQRKMKSGADVDNIRAVLDYSRKLAKTRGLTGEDADVFSKMNLRDSLGLNEYQVDSIFSKDFSDILKNPSGKMSARVRAGRGEISKLLNTDLKNNLGFNSSKAEAIDEFQQSKIYGDELLKGETALKNFKTTIGNAGRITREKQFKNMSDDEVSESARRSGPPGSTTAGSDYYAIRNEEAARKWGGETVRLEGTNGLETAIKDLTEATRQSNKARWRQR